MQRTPRTGFAGRDYQGVIESPQRTFSQGNL